MMDARRLLDSHSLNYTYQGAQILEILWWKCPPEHWESLRSGGVLGRELTWTSVDMQLLMLERMRLVDMAHAWGLSNLQGTARYLGRLRNFGQKYGIELFPKVQITQPPRSAVISLLLGVLEYTLQTSQKFGEGIKYNNAMSLQSAASIYHLWEKMLQFPGHMYRDRDNNVIGASPPADLETASATIRRSSLSWPRGLQQNCFCSARMQNHCTRETRKATHLGTPRATWILFGSRNASLPMSKCIHLCHGQ
jgi:hypothetical protein